MLIELLSNKIQSVDFNAAKEDVFPFIKDIDSLSLWSTDFFMTLLENLQYI